MKMCMNINSTNWVNNSAEKKGLSVSVHDTEFQERHLNLNHADPDISHLNIF